MTALKILKNNPEKSEVKREIILRTRNFQAIQNACQTAVEHKRLIALTGESGLGKTVGLKYFTEHNRNVFMVTVRPSMKAKMFWVYLLEMVAGVHKKGENFNYNHRSMYYIIQSLCEKLKALENPLLIIDESGKLTDKLLLNVHELRDETMNHLGIIFSGPSYYRKNMDRWALRGKQGIPELLTRIQNWLELGPPTAFELRKVCEAHGITEPEVMATMLTGTNDFRTLHNRITEHFINSN